MLKRTLLVAALLSCLPAAGRDKPENWLQVRSDHFIVATNSNEKQARRVADQFERMRSVFQARFTKLQIDPAAPIVVLALKDEKDFRALEPVAYLAKGQLKLGGLFLRAPDKNYILMRLDAEGDHPYEVVYHEYTHLLLAKSAEWLPLWLNEGLAEFYQNTDIRDKEVLLGEPSAENLTLLRQQSLLPLPTLFKVDEKSPYYHEENKGSIFYAESWALTHYIQMTDAKQNTHKLTELADLLSKKTDPIEAATRVFGDLQQLQRTLENYVHQAGFLVFKVPGVTQVDDSKFQLQPLLPPQSDALRADFLAYNDRTGDARGLLDQVLRDDRNNTSAHETMGYLAFRAGNLDEAKKWYGEAVHLDSHSYLAYYYFAVISMRSPGSSSDDAQIENSLREAIKLNPQFAPAFDSLAVFLGMHHRNLDEAHMMGLTAVALEPENVGYRINVANVLMMMRNSDAAIQVLQAAAKLARTPQEVEQVNNFLMSAQAFAAAKQRVSERQQETADAQVDVQTDAPTDVDSAPTLQHRAKFVPKGPHRFLLGVLKDVHCKNPEMDITVTSKVKNLSLHADNYYQIQFTTLNFTPQGDLNPCKDLEGRPAKVEYEESADESMSPRVLAIELHK
jgi:tetratricopeptide (TPR) repeat protein